MGSPFHGEAAISPSFRLCQHALRAQDASGTARPATAPPRRQGDLAMHTFAAAGAGFLLAVLWFDLMFDVQTRKHQGNVLSVEVLTSISAYYRRVTPEAYPMNRLIALVMLLTLAAICAEVVQGEYQWWIGWGSLLLAGGGFVPTMMRTVPNARRLGNALVSAEGQSRPAPPLSRWPTLC